MEGSFKKTYSVDKRIESSSKILKKHSNRIPVIIEQAVANRSLMLRTNKFLVSNETSIALFLLEIRSKSNLQENEAIFLYANGDLIPTSFTMKQTYDKYKDPDGFLYIIIAKESTYSEQLEYIFDNILKTSQQVLKYFSII